jgi:hypothetical protein
MITPQEKKEYWVAKNMMLVSNKGAKLDDAEVEAFIEKYKDIIDSVMEHMPRGMNSIGAAAGKCAIKYGPERAIGFMKRAKEGIFEGKDDPVYHFYLWLRGLKGPKRKKNDISTYEISLYACKQYCMGKKIKRLDRSKDIFSWTKDWGVE